MEFKHPFRLQISGPSGSGKSTFVAALLKSLMDDFIPVIQGGKPSLIVWVYSEMQSLYAVIKDVT